MVIKWRDERNILTAIMMNPSNASHKQSDDSVDQFAYDFINWRFISKAVSYGQATFLGWGMKGQKGIIKQLDSHFEIINVLELHPENYMLTKYRNQKIKNLLTTLYIMCLIHVHLQKKKYIVNIVSNQSQV